MCTYSPGEWYVAEVQKSLRGLTLPYAVTRSGVEMKYLDFSFRPKLLYSPSQHPPIVEDKQRSVSQAELRCLQALGRMEKGNEHEVASLAGLPADITQTFLTNMAERKQTVYKTSPKTKRDKSKLVQMDLFPLGMLEVKGHLWHHEVGVFQ